MQDRQLIILCTIGNIDITRKSITEVSVSRNWSDVADDFSITLIDSPEVSTYDLELYMNAGFRNITLKYGDLANESKLTSFKGTIWNYTDTFVGNIKQLTITGKVNLYRGNSSGVSMYAYNIDWNNYFFKRKDPTDTYSALSAHVINTNLQNDFVTLNPNVDASQARPTDEVAFQFRASSILNQDFKTALLQNVETISLKGPGGSIDLPVPDSFYPVTPIPSSDELSSGSWDAKNYENFNSVINDPDHKYWGPLEPCGVKKVVVTMEDPVRLPSSTTARYFLYGSNSTPGESIPDGYEFTGSTDYDVIDETTDSVSTIWRRKASIYWQGDKYKDQLTLEDPWDYWGYGDTYYRYMMTDSEGKVHIFYTLTTHNFQPSGGVQDIVGFVENGYIYMGYDIQLKRDSGSMCVDYTKVEQTTESEKLVTDYANEITYYGEHTNSGGDPYIRAFIMDGTLYVQANPEANWYGGAGFLKSTLGVDIAYIVKQLCKLEGWKTKDEYITQTELVPNSNNFIMQDQGALDFIQNNLIPQSITAVGEYTTKDGKKYIQTKSEGGYTAFFDSKGYFHYQPLSKDILDSLSIPNLGYNMPNSPTISFQVNTKGTSFYTFQPVTINAISMTSGKEIDSVQTISDAQENLIKQTPGHNDSFDAWLGLSYEDADKKLRNIAISSQDSLGNITYNETSRLDTIAKIAQKTLVTTPQTRLPLSSASSYNDVSGRLLDAKRQIETFTVTATMDMWGDYRIKPAGYIQITNMVKGGTNNSNYPVVHPTSGTYIIKKLVDKISSSGYIQSLELYRYNGELAALINPHNIDYSIGASFVGNRTVQHESVSIVKNWTPIDTSKEKSVNVQLIEGQLDMLDGNATF